MDIIYRKYFALYGGLGNILHYMEGQVLNPDPFEFTNPPQLIKNQS